MFTLNIRVLTKRNMRQHRINECEYKNEQKKEKKKSNSILKREEKTLTLKLSSIVN